MSPDQTSDDAQTARSVMIAGELLNWSDLQPTDAAPAVSGPVPAELLAAVLRPADSVLVAGPHALELVEQVARTVASVDVLVRSAPDAEKLAELSDVRVFCGTLDHFGPEHGEAAYDVVVALDGLPRLLGPDTPAMTWTDTLDALKARLASGGRLLLAAENSFGIERLVQADPTITVPRDGDWPLDTRGDTLAPAGLKAVRAALDVAGLTVTSTYAVYPILVEPVVALTEPAGPLPAATIARSVAARFSGPTLTDPYRTMQDAAAAGLGAELAPAWYFVTGTDSPAVLPAGAVPEGAGVLLEEELATTLRLDDHAALRRTVSAYATWLRDQPAEVAGAAAPDNVIADGTAYRLFGEPADGAVVQATGDALVVAQLGRFVRRALEAGARPPWTAGGSPRDLTARLVSMTGVTLTDELWVTVADSNEMVRPLGSAEQLATIARLAQELSEATAQARWFEAQLKGIRMSKPYRVGQAVLNPARVVVRRAKRVTRRVVS